MTNPKTIILAPGWGETHLTVARLAKLIEKLGYHPVPAKRVRPKKTDNVMDIRAHNVIATIDQLGAAPATVLAHSLGALDAVKAATWEPSKFAELILFNPAGLAGPMSTKRLLWRFTRKKVADQFRRRHRVAPGPRSVSLITAFREGLAAARSDTRPEIADLLRRGVKVTVLATRKDILFKFGAIKAGLPKSRLLTFIEIGGRHDSIHHEPDQFSVVLKDVLAG